MEDKDRTLRYGSPWTRDELILAFELYCRIPFGQCTHRNPQVIALAERLHRTPSSVARKLGNFGSFDPELRKRNVSGLVHAGKRDKEVWDEFYNDWNRLVLEARRLRDSLALPAQSDLWADSLPELPTIPEGPSERDAILRVRIHQAFFRDAVLSSYDDTCCVTGLHLRDCLIASHIVPWHRAENLRADPRNGLCLSATFDRLFDRGLFTVSSSHEIVVSPVLRRSSDPLIQTMICRYHGERIARPHRFLPLSDHLAWHRENVFRDAQ
jgi:hypothetical protein